MVTRGIVFSVVVSLVATLLLSCGGGGGGGIPPERPAGQLTGVAFDGHIVNGTVTVRAFDDGVPGEQLGQTSTDTSGFYGLDINTRARPILLEVTGGSYVEEASGVLVSLADGQSLQAVINYEPGRAQPISLTYYTHLASGLARFLIAQGQGVASSIDEANRLVSAFSLIDIVATEPVEATNGSAAGAALTAGLRYGFYAAGISQWTREANERQALAPHSLYRSIQFAQLAFDDIATDGVLDGQGARGQLNMGSVLITRDVYIQELPLAMARFVQSARNQTGLNAAQVFEGLSPQAEAAALFGGGDVEFFAGDGPTITEISPADGALVAGDVTIKATIFDPIGISATTLALDGATIAQFGAEQSIQHVLDTRGLGDGVHQFTITAANGLAVSKQVQFSLNVRNVDFAFGDVTPAPQSVVSKTFSMSVPMADPTGIAAAEVVMENGDVLPFTDLSAPQVLIDSTKLADGARDFVVNVDIIDGREEQMTVEYIVDNTAPTLETSGFSNGAAVKGNLQWTATATDANAIRTIELWVNGAKQDSVTNQSTVSKTLDTTKLKDGSTTVKCVAKDVAGNVREVSFTFIVDNAAPAVAIAQPTAGAVISGNSEVTGQITDGVAVAVARIAFGDEPSTRITDLPDFTWRWNSRNYPDGPLTISVSATDDAGHQTSRSVSVVIDNGGPAISMTQPTDGAVVSGNSEIRGRIDDAVGVGSAEIVIGSDAPQSITDLPAFTRTWDTRNYPDGPLTIVVSATDSAGRKETKSISVTIDNSVPEVELQSPADGSVFNSDFRARARVTDRSAVQSVTFFMGDAAYPAANASKPEADISVAGLADGVYPLVAEATDGTGAAGRSATISVTVDKTPPQLAIGSSYDFDVATQSCVVSLSAEDNLSGMASSSADGTNFGTASGTWAHSVRIARDSQAVIDFTGTDVAGNQTTVSRCVARETIGLIIDICRTCP